MKPGSIIDGRKTRRELEVGGCVYDYYSIAAAEALGMDGVARLPESALPQFAKDAAAGKLPTVSWVIGRF